MWIVNCRHEYSMFVIGSYLKYVVENLSKFYLTKIKGFDMNELCVMTLLFEGDEDDVKINEKKIITLAKDFGGISAGESSGEKGYMLTYVIAYVRVSITFNFSRREILCF